MCNLRRVARVGAPKLCVSTKSRSTAVVLPYGVPGFWYLSKLDNVLYCEQSGAASKRRFFVGLPSVFERGLVWGWRRARKWGGAGTAA